MKPQNQFFSIRQEPESTFPVDENPYKIVITFIKENPDEPVTADVSLIGCFKPCG